MIERIEKQNNTLTLEEALKYQEALSNILKHEATTSDYVIAVKLGCKKYGIKLGKEKDLLTRNSGI